MEDEINEMDCGLKEIKNETWSIKCGLKEMRWNMNNEVWTEGNEMKYEQWSQYCNTAELNTYIF